MPYFLHTRSSFLSFRIETVIKTVFYLVGLLFFKNILGINYCRPNCQLRLSILHILNLYFAKLF